MSYTIIPSAGVGTIPAPDALWLLGGDGTDESVNALTVSGTINSQYVSAIDAVGGYNGTVPNFPGNTILSRINADVSVIQTLGDITIAQLVRPVSGNASLSMTIDQYDSSSPTRDYAIGVGNAGNLIVPWMMWGGTDNRVYAKIADSFTGTDFMQLPLYDWSWVVTRRDAGGTNSVCTFWVDGVKSDDTVPQVNAAGVCGAQIHIGRQANASGADFVGQISQTAIWTSALADSVVDELNTLVMP